MRLQRSLEVEPSCLSVPEEFAIVWKGVINIREHLRTKKQEFQITKGRRVGAR